MIGDYEGESIPGFQDPLEDVNPEELYRDQSGWHEDNPSEHDDWEDEGWDDG